MLRWEHSHNCPSQTLEHLESGWDGYDLVPIVTKAQIDGRSRYVRSGSKGCRNETLCTQATDFRKRGNGLMSGNTKTRNSACAFVTMGTCQALRILKCLAGTVMTVFPTQNKKTLKVFDGLCGIR